MIGVKIWRFLACGVAMSWLGSGHAVELSQPALCPTVTQEMVIQHAKQTGSSLKKRRVIRAGLITAAVGVFFYQSYTLIAPWFADDEERPVTPKKHRFSSGKMWQGVGVFGLQCCASILLGQILQVVMGKYIVPDTLSWFVHVCAPYRKVMLEIDAHVTGLEQALKRKTGRDGYYLQAIATAYRDLVARLIEVLGYMQFRSSDLAATTRLEAEQLVAHLIATINEHSSQFADLVADGVDHYGMLRVLDSLGSEIDVSCLHFSRLEGSFWHDGAYIRSVTAQRKRHEAILQPQPKVRACKVA